MKRKLKIILLLYYVTRIIIVAYVVAKNDSFSKKKVLEVERKQELLKKGVVKSIMSEDGDIIDCVEIYKQTAFNHPVLTNHIIQMVPSNNPAIKNSPKGTKDDENLGSWATTVTSQLWQRSGSCPKGTIPIRRKQKGFHRQKSEITSRNSKHLISEENGINFLEQNRSLAILLAEGYSYLGAKGDIKVWNPFVESDDEYSTSRIALNNGPSTKSETVQSGWAVNPTVYGDNQTRLFVYWTADSSKETGCFDLTCPGFVQTSSEIALGAAINPISLPGQLPYQITIHIFKDPMTNNWWIRYGERINIGYWPPDLFTSLKYNAIIVEWGGEVYSSKIGTHKPHTKTEMGTGLFADWAFKDSGWVRRMRVDLNSRELRYPEYAYTYTDEYNCYDVELLSDYVEDPELYYGGPGKNPQCP